MNYLITLFSKSFGYTIEDIPDMETWWRRAYPDEDYRRFVRKETLPQMGFSQNSQQIVRIFQKEERLITCKDGRQRYVELYGTSIMDKVFVIFIDNTDQKQTEQALQEAVKRHQELAQIVNSSPSIVFLWKVSEGWPVEFVSDNVIQFGYSPDDFYNGRIPYSALIHPDDIKRIEDEVAQYFNENVDEFSQEYRVITRSGEIRWAEDPNLAPQRRPGENHPYAGSSP